MLVVSLAYLCYAQSYAQREGEEGSTPPLCTHPPPSPQATPHGHKIPPFLSAHHFSLGHSWPVPALRIDDLQGTHRSGMGCGRIVPPEPGVEVSA